MFTRKIFIYLLIAIGYIPLNAGESNSAIQYTSFAGSIPCYGESKNLFDDESIAEIRLTIDSDSLAWLYKLENVKNERDLSASFSFQNGRIHQWITLPAIGLRLRGAIPRYSKKRDFKISFDAFESGQNFLGVKKLNLRGFNRDPGMIREKLVLDLLRDIHVPCSRASYARFYINDEYYGLYLMVEEVDKIFLNSHFGNTEGNLYKCARAALEYREDGNYKYTYGPLDWAPCDSGRVYELQTNEAEDNYSDLAHFIEVLNKTSDAEFKEAIEKIFNVRDFLKSQAVDVLVGNCDCYWFNGNNYYLYHNTWTDRFEFIPRDLDLTLGDDWAPVDKSTSNIYNFGPRDNSVPLINRILNVAEFKGLYSRFIREIIDGPFNPDSLWPKVMRIKSMIQLSADSDRYRTYDYGWTMDDFNNSYFQGLGSFHAINYPIPFDLTTNLMIGLKPYIEARTASAYKQLDLSHIPPAISGTNHIPKQPSTQDSVTIVATVTNFGAVGGVILHIDMGSGFEQRTMLDDGKHGDGGARDSVYGYQIPPLAENQIVRYYVSAHGDTESDSTNDPSDAPHTTYMFKVGGFPSLVINEFMAKNDHTISDERGKYRDWLELYNAGNEIVHLSNMYLSDDLTNSSMWQFPDTTISPDGFVLVWADGGEDPGPLHTNFKLNKGGGQIGLFYRSDTAVLPIDQFIFDPQMTDVSYGRLPDGNGDWRSFTKATPGRSNTEGEVWLYVKDERADPIRQYRLFQNYPNPFNPTTTISYELAANSYVRLKIYDILGREVATLVNGKQNAGYYHAALNASNLPSGVYFYRVQAGSFVQTKKLVLVK